MNELTILVPVLRRPRNVKPLVESIRTTTKIDHEILFILSPGNKEEFEAIMEVDCIPVFMLDNFENNGDYARKINAGYSIRESEWYFTGADDLKFHPNWFENAMKINTCVIGTNDLGNSRVISGRHATHSLVNRQYVEEQGTIDEKGKILHEGYQHEWVDDELVETAKKRGCWGMALDSHVEHLHPLWGKAPTDDIYDRHAERMAAGRALYMRRRHLWA